MSSTEVVMTASAASLVSLLIVAAVLRGYWWPAARRHFENHTDDIDSLPISQLPFWIALAAGLGLFAELMMIRIHSSYFQLFAYFKNVSLLSCFLGLGIGYIRGARRPVMTSMVIPLLAIQIVLLYLMRFSPIAQWLHSPVTETVAFGFSNASRLGQFFTVYAFLIAVFLFNAFCFVPLGHLASRMMMRIDRLPSYGWNLLGSLAGICVFCGLSSAWSPPSIWVIVFGAGFCLFMIRRPRGFAFAAGITLIVVVVLSIPISSRIKDIYSPYQILTVLFKKDAPPEIKACNTFHQNIHDLRPENIGDKPMLKRTATFYAMPYLFRPNPAEVLILGCGAGNDAATALRHGVKHVDAVEIDPAIMDCGRRWHPEMPYQSARVTAIVDDARSFIKKTDKKYDLVAYGLLDSHSLLSGACGGVRLDSYVYTVEAFREAREILKPGGVLVLSFCVMNWDLGNKLYLMLKEAFDGIAPRAFSAYGEASVCFVVSESMDEVDFRVPAAIHDVTASIVSRGGDVDPSTDNWPFFYMARRKLPISYVIMIVVLAAAAVAFTLRLAPGSGSGFSMPCFFLGAGFMLIETKSITELALVFGSTWVVISIVVAAILIMAFLANLLVIKIGAPRPEITYSLLGIALLVGLAQTFVDLDFLSLRICQLLMTSLLTLPLFFSGFAFSTELKKSVSVAVALSSNLLGAMLGGFLEYNAMFFGYRSLYIIALIMYGLAYLGSIRRRGAVKSLT